MPRKRSRIPSEKLLEHQMRQLFAYRDERRGERTRKNASEGEKIIKRMKELGRDTLSEELKGGDPLFEPQNVPERYKFEPILGTPHSRVRLTQHGKSVHAFQPLKRNWDSLTKTQQERYAKRFRVLAKEEAERSKHKGSISMELNVDWKRVIATKISRAQQYIETLENKIKYGSEIDPWRDARFRKYIQGWKNLIDVLEHTIKEGK